MKKQKGMNERGIKEEYIVGGKVLPMFDVSPAHCGFVGLLTGPGRGCR
jgi:hypothetical protein